MAFASSLFCSSKFLEHTNTLTKRLTVLACSDNTKDVRTYPFRFRFLAHFTLMLDFFLCQNIGWRYRRGRKKNCPAKKKKILFFFFFVLAQWFCVCTKFCGKISRGPKKKLTRKKKKNLVFSFFWHGAVFLRPSLSGALGD